MPRQSQPGQPYRSRPFDLFPEPCCFRNLFRRLTLRCLPSLVPLAALFLPVGKVAKTEAHLQATLRPERELEETLRALPSEGKQGEHVLAEVCIMACAVCGGSSASSFDLFS